MREELWCLSVERRIEIRQSPTTLDIIPAVLQAVHASGCKFPPTLPSQLTPLVYIPTQKSDQIFAANQGKA